MSDVDRILDQLRRSLEGDAWHGPSLLEVLDGVDIAVATSRPIPSAHTIAELVLHVTTWMRVTEGRLEGRWPEVNDAEDFPPQPGDETGWKGALDGLDAAVASLDQALSRSSDDNLSRHAPHGQYTLGLMLDGVVQHNLYHAGQMAILKRVRQLEGLSMEKSPSA